MGDIVDWMYAQVVEFLSNFFEQMGNMGAELFELNWVQGVVIFVNYLGWSLFAVGFAVAVCEFGIDYQSVQASLKDTGINILKGFFAASLFSTVPVELYKLSISLQGDLTRALSGISEEQQWTVGKVAWNLVNGLTAPGGGHIMFSLFIVIEMGYCVVKIFFANLKRGGILLIQIAVGSLYLFSVPRGYIDGFISWGKQVIALCLTAFLQAVIRVAGLMVFNDHALLGLGVMLSAGEIPRIAGTFGLDTSTRGNLSGAIYTAQQVLEVRKELRRS